MFVESNSWSFLVVVSDVMVVDALPLANKFSQIWPTCERVLREVCIICGNMFKILFFPITQYLAKKAGSLMLLSFLLISNLSIHLILIVFSMRSRLGAFNPPASIGISKIDLFKRPQFLFLLINFHINSWIFFLYIKGID